MTDFIQRLRGLAEKAEKGESDIRDAETDDEFLEALQRERTAAIELRKALSPAVVLRMLEALETLGKIAEMDGEDNEWDAVSKYHECQSMAAKSLARLTPTQPQGESR